MPVSNQILEDALCPIRSYLSLQAPSERPGTSNLILDQFLSPRRATARRKACRQTERECGLYDRKQKTNSSEVHNVILNLQISLMTSEVHHY